MTRENKAGGVGEWKWETGRMDEGETGRKWKNEMMRPVPERSGP